MTSLRVGSASVRTVFLMFGLLICSFVKTASAGDRYAFLVGVKQYDKTQLNSLAYTEADVTALADALRKAGYADKNIVLMTQAGGATNFRHLPSSQQIRKELNLLLGELNTDDTLLLAFSGHGVQFKDETNVYFCPMDANLKDRKTLISLTDVYDMLADPKTCKAQTKVLLVDACRNDPQSNLSKAGREIELDPAGVSEQPEPPGGVAAFFSCSRGQKSYEHPDLGHGIFANYIIEAFGGKGDLDKDGEISLAELEQYSVKQTQSYVRVELGERQTPERRGTVRGLIPLGTFNTLQDILITNSIGMKLNLIPAGEFMMGSPADEADRQEHEGPQHNVRITKAFYLGVTEVTQGQWFAVMKTKPWEGKEYVKDGDNYPATYVSWDDSVEYCQKLSALEGKRYRLPTEAEWEYACRGGKSTLYSFGSNSSLLKNFAWFDENAWNIDEKFAHVAGTKQSNPFGLYDMHGNVWEWCSDGYDKEYYSASPVSDPAGPSTGSDRVNRGGSWFNTAGYCRSALRSGGDPSSRYDSLGFRLVLSPSGQ